jgi:RND family efflux transporter MFP subunit
MDGVVGRKFADEGDMVSPGSPIASILPMDRLKFLLNIPDIYLSNIKQSRVELAVDAWPGRTFACQIEKVYPEINTQTRTFTMELSAPNPPLEDGSYPLRPGMYATAKIALERKENVIVVPADSLIRLSGRYYTFIVEDGIARRREVVVGLWSGNNMEIKEGLKVDQQMVVNGQDKLTDNTPVAIIGPAQQGGIR